MNKSIYIELEKHKLDQIAADSCKKRKSAFREMYTFLEVKLRRLRRKTYEDK